MANATTIIVAKIVRNQTGTGSCLISSGFPVPPGLVTEQLVRAGKIKILVEGTEVPANVSALRGRHTDGTVRSILIQFSRTMAQNDELTANVIVDGGVRAYPDPAYTRPTLAIVTNNNVIVPSDKNYLVITGITLRGLLPTGSGTTTEEAFYSSMAINRFDWLSSFPTINEVGGTANYENVSSIISLWARSGDVKYQKKAVEYILHWLPENTPDTTVQSPSCRDIVTVVNSDGRSGGQLCGMPSEWDFAKTLSYAQMYLLTGYRDFWGIVAVLAQFQQNMITSQSDAYANLEKYQEWDTPRFNYATKYGALLAALMIDATIPVNGQWFDGRVYNWTNQITWTIDALNNWKWDFKWIHFNSGSGTVPAAGGTISHGGVTATLLGVYPATHYGRTYNSMHDEQVFAGSAMPSEGYLMVNNISGGSFTTGSLTISGGISATAMEPQITDYREGLVAGVRPNSPRGLTSTGDSSCIPIFQLIFPSHFLIDTYLYFYRDPRIPDIIQKQVDIILTNIRPKAPGDVYYKWTDPTWGTHSYVKPYSLENPVDTGASSTCGGGNDAMPFELPEYARLIAFVIKTKGDATVNGALYSTWYDRVINTANAAPLLMNWLWKYYGQYYGWGQDAPWMMKQSSLTNYGPLTMRNPIQYTTIPGDLPDVYSNRPNVPVNLQKIVK